MFDELVESSAVKKKTNKSWAVTLSVVVQTLILLVLILIPLIYTQALPKAMLSTLLIAPPPPPPPPPPPQAAPVKVVKPVARLLTQGKLMAPRAIPKDVAVFKEAELPPEPPAGSGVIGGLGGGDILGGLGGGSSASAPCRRLRKGYCKPASNLAGKFKPLRLWRNLNPSIRHLRVKRVFKATLYCTRSSIKTDE